MALRPRALTRPPLPTLVRSSRSDHRARMHRGLDICYDNHFFAAENGVAIPESIMITQGIVKEGEDLSSVRSRAAGSGPSAATVPSGNVRRRVGARSVHSTTRSSSKSRSAWPSSTRCWTTRRRRRRPNWKRSARSAKSRRRTLVLPGPRRAACGRNRAGILHAVRSSSPALAAPSRRGAGRRLTGGCSRVLFCDGRGGFAAAERASLASASRTRPAQSAPPSAPPNRRPPASRLVRPQRPPPPREPRRRPQPARPRPRS